MNSSPLPFDIPKRQSLAAQAAASIGKAIDDGTWQEFLPSERRLCEMLRVSRPTIRTALRMLAKNGLLEIRQGRRNRLLAPRQPTSQQSRLVGLVTPEPFSHMATATYQIISEMRTHLAEHGFTTEVLVCQAHSARAQRRKLDEFVRQNRVFCCVLLSVSKDVQQWFSGHSVPALVLGSCHQDVKLPSLDTDYRSVCRHAGGIFLSRGHRRMALIVPHSEVAGDIASEKGFLEAIQNNRHQDARATIVRHNGTAQNITTKLDALFNSAHAPTALLVAKPQHVFIVIIYLLKRGLTVPDTVSFIARDYDHIFETVSPPIAHYSLHDDTFAHRLLRLMLQMVSHDHLASEPNLIFPKYFAGGTVKQLG
jgi:LacI family transcriptional regulator